jgi:prepilin-type processing-associated H-X9-DG protein
MSCTNNLKQIGIALHNFHDANNYLPPAAELVPHTHDEPLSGGTETTRNSGWGVTALILPFAEQTALYVQVGVGQSESPTPYDSWLNDTDVSPNKGIQQKIAGYACPSDSEGRDPDDHWSFPGADTASGENSGLGRTDYLANRGFFSFGIPPAEAPDAGATRNFTINTGPFPASWQEVWRGSGQGNIRYTFGDIIDGLSNVAGFGERKSGATKGAGWWPGPHAAGPLGRVTSSVSDKLNAPDSSEAYSSYHSGGGANFLYLDGSVHFVSETISFNTADIDYGFGSGIAGPGSDPDTGMDGDDREVFYSKISDVGLFQLIGTINSGQAKALP